MPNKYEKLTEPHKMINNIFANVNAGIEAGKKPLDKAIEACNKDPLITLESSYIKQVKKEIEELRTEKDTLKKSLSKAGVLIEELKKDNKLLKA